MDSERGLFGDCGNAREIVEILGLSYWKTWWEEIFSYILQAHKLFDFKQN